MAYFAISYGSFVLLLNLNGIIMSVLISSPKIQVFPFGVEVGITGGGGAKVGGAGVKPDGGPRLDVIGSVAGGEL
ncbi:MAG: hypothetical protein ACJ70Z_02670 [Nitrososphaera sp.]